MLVCHRVSFPCLFCITLALLCSCGSAGHRNTPPQTGSDTTPVPLSDAETTQLDSTDQTAAGDDHLGADLCDAGEICGQLPDARTEVHLPDNGAELGRADSTPDAADLAPDDGVGSDQDWPPTAEIASDGQPVEDSAPDMYPGDTVDITELFASDGGADTDLLEPCTHQSDCEDDNLCTDDFCNAQTGHCVHETANEGRACDDRTACTFDDICHQGQCLGQPVYCDDGNVCTDDACDNALSMCIHPPNAAPCDDGDPQTDLDLCEAGECVGTCLPKCTDRNCGDDGCGGICGTCADTETCISGRCAPQCPPFCNPLAGCAAPAVYDGTGHAYYFCDFDAKWSDAQAFCQSHGGYLVSLLSTGENDFVAALSGSEDQIWTGGNDQAHEGTFAWNSGETWSWTAWDDGEPNDGGWFVTENCMELYPDNARWNDEECDNEQRFVCEIGLP